MSDRIDVRMPDGTIVRNVPRGTSKADLERRYKEGALKRRTAEHPILGPITSAVAGATDMGTMSADDEIRAGLDSVNPFNPDSVWRGGSFGGNQKRQSSRKKQLERANPWSYLGGQVAGAVIPALLTGGGSVAAQAAAKAPAAIRAMRALAPTVAQSAAYGFNSADGGVKNRLKAVPEAVAWGVGGDLVGRGLGKVASRAIGGRNFSPAQRQLMDEGVLLTPGARGGKVAKMVEDKVFGSIPPLDEVAKMAQERSFATLRRAAANRVLAPIGGKVDDVAELAGDSQAGADFAGNLAKTVYKNYDDTLGSMTISPDPAVFQQLDDLVNNAGLTMTRDQVEVLANNVANTKEKLSKGPLTGKPLREWLGDLRERASKLAGTESGDALWELNSRLEDALDVQNGAMTSEAYKKAREAVSLLKRYQNAASRRGAGGEFTPTQLLQAAEKRGFGTTDANVSDRTAPMLKFAMDAADVMRVNTANSGTVPRGVVTGGLLGATGGVAAIDPLIGGLLATQTLKYVPGIDELVQNIARRPDWARKAGERISTYAPSLGLLGLGTGLGLSQ